MYDTLYLMRECIKSTGVAGDDVKADRIKLRDCWSSMNGLEAPLMGATSIDKNGDGIASRPYSRSRGPTSL